MPEAYFPMALDLMVKDYESYLRFINEGVKNAFLEGRESYVFHTKDDITFTSWVYRYADDNGFGFNLLDKDMIEIVFKKR